ncbi:MAG: hypothetical protein IPM48_15080 [Saprospiraceae bacterium]|nr:hypothetical protein [Saprospiraceae bacterium]
MKQQIVGLAGEEEYLANHKPIMRIGDYVEWKGAWNTEKPKIVKIMSIEVECIGKSGIEVQEVEWEKVNNEQVIVTLDNKHWAYGYQIKQPEIL